jgi:hypothetical protein
MLLKQVIIKENVFQMAQDIVALKEKTKSIPEDIFDKIQ